MTELAVSRSMPGRGVCVCVCVCVEGIGGREKKGRMTVIKPFQIGRCKKDFKHCEMDAVPEEATI